MTDPAWPDQLEVAFAPEALHRERKTAVRTLRVTAWGWLALAALAVVAILLPLATSTVDGLYLLLAIWFVLIIGMLAMSVRSFVALARCSAWRNGEQPKYALRLSSQGLWITGTTTYEWPSITALRARRIFGRSYLFVRLKSGVRPDAPVVAGLAEVHGPARRRLPLTPRGPRLLLSTIDLPAPQLALAVRHYSQSQLTID